uniref:Proliferation-associated SNF2-like protein n=1 Tax=Strigamia maritima TaxID=126957 RepID=T1J7U4_STRMM
MSINDKLSSWDPPVPPWKMEVLLKKQSLLHNGTNSEENDVAKSLKNINADSAVHPHAGLHASESKHKDWEALRSKPGTKYLDSSSSGIHSEQGDEAECIEDYDSQQNIKETRYTSGVNATAKNRMGEEKYLDVKRTQLETVPSPSFSSYSDGFAYENGELEYGPGIVNRLCSRFSNWSKENKGTIRRVASMEHMSSNDVLDGSFEFTGFKKSPRSAMERRLPFKAKRKDVLKKARSMETLSYNEPTNIFVSTKLKSVGFQEKIPSSLLINENVIIIEQPKNGKGLKTDESTNSGSQNTFKRNFSIEENELPKPDMVRTVKKLFESDLCNQQGKNNTLRRETTATQNSNQAKTILNTANNFHSEAASTEGSSKFKNSLPKHKKDGINGKVDSLIASKIQEINVNSSPHTQAQSEKWDQDQIEASTKSCNVLPRVVSAKQKSEDKPIGLIRPISVAATGDEKENLINKAKSAGVNLNSGNNLIETNINEDFVNRKSLRKSNASPDTENTIIFNFTSKPNITPNIRNTESSFSVVRPIVRIDKNSGKLISNIHKDGASGVIFVPGCHNTSSQDFSDDEDTFSYPSGEVKFEGENVSLEKTCFLSRRNKQLKIEFKENNVETFEYPSEDVMLAYYLETHGEELTGEVDNNKIATSSVNNIQYQRNDLNTNLSNNLGDLANYVPSQLNIEKFELGVSRPEPILPVQPKVKPETSSTDDEESFKPASDDQASSWSSSQQDILMLGLLEGTRVSKREINDSLLRIRNPSISIAKKPDDIELMSMEEAFDGSNIENMNCNEEPRGSTQLPMILDVNIRNESKELPMTEKISKDQELELRAARLKQFQQVLSTSKFYTTFLNQCVDQLKETQIAQENSQRPPKRTRINTGQTEKPESPIKLVIRKRVNNKPIENKSDENIDKEEEIYDVSFKEETRKTPSGEEIPNDQPKWLTGAVMRPYQIDGFKWLKTLHANKVNGILADEMGLGKTIQSIALIAQLFEENVYGPHLIIAPLSTLGNWVSEFARFTPLIPTILYHGPQDERNEIWKKFRRRRVKKKLIFPVIITNYDSVLIDRKRFKEISWNYIIIDEGHRLKNPKSQLVQLLNSFTSTNRLLLTGTPLHNNLTELWSLLNFLLPDIFDKLDVFESLFDVSTMGNELSDEKIAADEQQSHIVSMLHDVLSPFLLRRLKSDVELFLPPKKELLVYAPLTQKQQIYYANTVTKNILKILHPETAVEVLPAKRRRKCIHPGLLLNSYLDDKIDEDAIIVKAEEDAREKESELQATYALNQLKKLTYNRIRHQSIMMDLRKCVNHPYLLSHPVDEEGYGLINEDLVLTSGKMLVLDALLPKLKERGHKILLFSQMTRMLDIIQDYCSLRGYSYSILTGRDSLDEREENIKSFCTDPENFLFLISTRAGGLGLNLVAADTVIVYDSDWNPQCDLQAVDRCHRIGQTKPVVIYRFVTANTIDQRIVDRAASKRKLEKLVMHKGNKFKSGVNVKKNFTKAEVLELLKAKDHEGVVESLSTENVFSSRELDVLLDRSAMINATTNAESSEMLKFNHFKVVDEC